MSEHELTVIGGGIGGLAAALTCAPAERDVLVLEAAGEFGGFINPFSRKHSWFDTGCAAGSHGHR
jgi:phytoene dehydrogenase-like protein